MFRAGCWKLEQCLPGYLLTEYCLGNSRQLPGKWCTGRDFCRTPAHRVPASRSRLAIESKPDQGQGTRCSLESEKGSPLHPRRPFSLLDLFHWIPLPSGLMEMEGRTRLADLPVLHVSQKMLPTAALRPIISLPPCPKSRRNSVSGVPCQFVLTSIIAVHPVAPFPSHHQPCQQTCQVLASYLSFRELSRISRSHTK